MSTVTELVFAEELSQLQQICLNRRWDLEKIEGPGFVLGLQSRDNLDYWLKVECDNYPTKPPAWHWYNKNCNTLDQPSCTPRGTGGYFHDSGRICATWNRLAYKQVDPLGPHADWELSNWKTNPKTIGCTSLCAMALRLAVELSSSRYQGKAA